MPRVDRSALKVNQAFIVGLNVLAFLLGTGRGGAWLVLFVGAVLALGAILPRAALFIAVYRYALKPAGLLRPDVRVEDPVQHQFAQGLGAAFLIAAFAALIAGADVLGWILAWVVIGLAFVNLTVSFCAGCFLYLQLGRLGVLPRAHREIA